MTAEICMMNRLAVVLAADSATTVTQWGDAGREDRYFKGANKIFQLSDHHPVGLMIFDAADILRVPWEIVVKSFRNELGKKSFNSLNDYAVEFFSFLETSARLFPPAVQKDVFLESARSAAIRNTVGQTNGMEETDRLAANNKIVADRLEHLQTKPLPPGLDQTHVDETLASWREDLVAMFESWRDSFNDEYPSDLGAFAELGIMEVFKEPGSHIGSTGLVFAGYGDHEIFPSLAEFKSCGMVAGKHVAFPAVPVAITHETPAWLASFAQTAMSDTFSLGISQDVYFSVMASLDEGLAGFARKIVEIAGGDLSAISNLQGIVTETRRGMGEAILDRARREHAMPLRRVLGVLPVDEMAELAETLINLQSLKEKVTKRSETVGGPVDVAIITKNEGLVWVKRKHFFDIGLNSRYLARQQSRLTQ
jgi:hypothetical protein